MLLFDLETIYAQIDEKKYISFDVFDTLLIRDNVLEPTDIFYLLALTKGLSHKKAEEFRKDRIKGEHLAREIKFIKADTREVNIDEIYNLIKPDYGIVSADELSFELEHLVARPLIRKVYDYAVSANKKIFAISDIYLPYDFIQSILKNNGYHVNEIYVSCEHGCGKYEKFLFEKFIDLENIAPEDVLHIGDNEKSDFMVPLSLGIQSFHIPNVIDYLFMNSSVNLLAIQKLHKADTYFAKNILAYVAWRLECDNKPSLMRLFAVIYALPLLTLFARWLITTASEKKVKKLLLMTRDGYALSPVLELFSDRPEFELLVVSRRSLFLPLVKVDAENWRKFFESVAEENIFEVIDGLNLHKNDEIKNILSELSVNAKSYNELRAGEKKKFIQKSLDVISDQVLDEYANMHEYLMHVIGKREDIAVVDVGWSLSSHKALETILDRKIRGFYLGCSPLAYHHNKMSFFLFNGVEKEYEDWLSIFYNAVELIELPFISKENRILSISGREFVESPPNAYENIRGLVADELRKEIFAVYDYNRQLPMLVDTEFMKNQAMLKDLFHVLAFNFNLYEKYLLGSIPHDRHLSSHCYNNISTYWNSSLPNNNVQSRLAFYSRIVLNSLLRNGIRVTWFKITRRFKNRFL